MKFQIQYVRKHRIEMMGLYSTIYTLLEFEPDNESVYLADQEETERIRELAAVYAMMSFLYFDGERDCRVIRSCLDTCSIDIDNSYHDEMYWEIKRLAAVHAMRIERPSRDRDATRMRLTKKKKGRANCQSSQRRSKKQK